MSLDTEKISELLTYTKIGDKISGDYNYMKYWRNFNNTQNVNLTRSLVAYKDIIVVDNNQITVMSMSDIYRRLNKLEKDNQILKEENAYLKNSVTNTSWLIRSLSIY